MGRNLELKQLTEEEEKKILEVIQRDYDLRKKEEKRIDKLKNEVETKPPPTQQQTTPSTDECNNCGSTLIWLINPKGQCTKCELYFCENKKDCLSEDFYTSKLMCTNCQIETDLQASSAEWFYSQLKGKFRRFGSAKVHRALRKLRRGRNIESASEYESENEYSTGTSKSSSPNKSPDKAFIKFMEQQREQEGNTPELTPIIESEKEHCELVMDEVPNANEILIKPTQTDELQSSLVPNGHASSEFNSSITDEHGAAATVNVDVKTTNVEVNNNPPQITPEELSQSVKKELELVISELLLPQLEQLRKHDEERNKEEKAERVEEATKIAEEVILRALEKSKHDESFNTSEAISRYLQDNSDLIISHVSNQMADEARSVHSVNSSIHDAKPEMRDSTTMTDIDQDKVASIKSESHTSISSSHSSFVQDAATKQHLIAQAETQTAIADILDTEASSHEFTTELTFTAVTPQSPELLKRSPRFKSSSESSSSSSSSSKPIKTEDNWVIPARDAKKISVDETATSTTLMSLAPATSAYDHHSTSDSSDTDSDEVKQKEDKMKSSSESSSSDFEENQELQKTKNKLDKELEIAISLSNQANKHIEEVPSRSHSSSESSSDDESKPAHSIEAVPTPTRISVEIHKEEIMKNDESESSDSSSSNDESKKILPNFIARKKSSSASCHTSFSDDESKKVTKEKDSSSESSDSDTEIIPQLVDRKTSHLEREVVKVGCKILIKEIYRVTTDSDPDRKSPAPMDENELIIKEFQVKKVFKTTANISIDETPSAITHTDSMSSESTNFTDGQIVETPKLERKRSQSSSSSSSSSSSDDSKRYTDELMDLKPVDESTLDETPLATFVQPEEVKSISPTPEESAVALRTINKVEIDMVADTIHKISELKKEEEDHDSSSDSSSSSSSSDSEEDKDKLDKIEEDIYIASAKTQQLQRQLKDYQREVQNIDLDKIRAGLRMSSVEKKVYFAQIDLSKINIEGLSIKERIELLRLAGLQVEQESLKRSSLQEMKSPEDKPRKRWSVPLNTPPKDPVNASNKTSIQPRQSFTIRPKSSSTPIQTTAKVQYRRSLDQNLLKGVSKPSGEITVQLPRNSVKVLPPQPVTRKREVEIKKLSSESSSSSSSSSSESEDEEVTNYMKATPVAEPIPVLEEVKKKSPVTAKLAPQIVETTTIPSPKPKIRKQNPLPLSEEDSLRIQQLVDDYDTGHSEEEIPSYKPDLYDGEDDLERELQAIKKFKEKRTSMLVEEANRKNQLVAQMSNSNILPEERDEDSNQSSVYNSDIDGKVVSKSTKQSKEQELNLATKILNKKLSKSPGSSIHSSFDSDVESKQKRAVNNSNLVEQKANGSNYKNASVDSSSDEEWTMQI